MPQPKAIRTASGVLPLAGPPPMTGASTAPPAATGSRTPPAAAFRDRAGPEPRRRRRSGEHCPRTPERMTDTIRGSGRPGQVVDNANGGLVREAAQSADRLRVPARRPDAVPQSGGSGMRIRFRGPPGASLVPLASEATSVVVSPFRKLLDHFRAEGGQVVRIAGGHQTVVDDDFFIHPDRAGVLEVDLQRRP